MICAYRAAVVELVFAARGRDHGRPDALGVLDGERADAAGPEHRHGRMANVALGFGGLPQLLVQAAQLDVGDRVIFQGQSLRVPDVLRASDAFVLSSHGEGMSNSLL